jgi:hypothetical protein
MKSALSMSSAFHTPVDYWLSLPLEELYSWIMAANAVNDERNKS